MTDGMRSAHGVLVVPNDVCLNYLYRGSGKRGFGTVHPCGFLYGTRHYLVAWSESDQARNF
jgi:predicted DNA-binding transcriptional regulator YafY